MKRSDKKSKILITGGAGFIGSAFVRQAAKTGRYKLVVVDNLTYAGDLKRIAEAGGRYKFYKLDICDKKRMNYVFKQEQPQVVVHFAAQTHVDRSILDSTDFIRTNIIGTQVLLDVSRKNNIKKFLNISTDEVYGEIARGSFNEGAPFTPSSPYAVSKAAADLLVKSYIRTYDFPAIIVRPCNNYGPWQYPEKLIPLACLRVLQGQKIPVYGRGANVREWLFVEDCAEALLEILKKGRIGEAYNLGSSQEKKNIEVVKSLLDILKAGRDGFSFVRDRPGHDRRYSLDSSKINKKIGWSAKTDFEKGLGKTLKWCIWNKQWMLSKAKGINRRYF